MANAQTHLIVFANEKGGTGKSTTAVHTAIALTALGHSVGLIDLDPRQRTVTRYMENRAETARRRGIEHRFGNRRVDHRRLTARALMNEVNVIVREDGDLHDFNHGGFRHNRAP